MLIVDRANEIAYANNAAEDFFGRSSRKMTGMQAGDILKFTDKAMARLLHADSGDISAQDTAIQTRDGVIYADISVAAMTDYPDWRLAMISPRYSERQNRGKYEHAATQQTLGAAAILGHEIKNPLAGIKGAAQLLARKADSGAKALTDLIITEVDRIARLLDQMQNLGDHPPCVMEPANIHLLIERAIRSIRAANPILPNISIDYDPSLPDILVNPDRMVQILINLIQNAIDASDKKDNSFIGIGTKFVLSGEYRGRSDAQRMVKLPVEISVFDNGPGIPPHIENELFAPFVTSKREGQGLGLAIVRKLIAQMNSRISYERDKARGITYFRIFLQLAPAAPTK